MGPHAAPMAQAKPFLTQTVLTLAAGWTMGAACGPIYHGHARLEERSIMKPVWCMSDCTGDETVERDDVLSEEALWQPLTSARSMDGRIGEESGLRSDMPSSARRPHSARTSVSCNRDLKDPRLSTRRRSLMGRQRRTRNCDLPVNVLAYKVEARKIPKRGKTEAQRRPRSQSKEVDITPNVWCMEGQSEDGVAAEAGGYLNRSFQ